MIDTNLYAGKGFAELPIAQIANLLRHYRASRQTAKYRNLLLRWIRVGSKVDCKRGATAWRWREDVPPSLALCEGVYCRQTGLYVAVHKGADKCYYCVLLDAVL